MLWLSSTRHSASRNSSRGLGPPRQPPGTTPLHAKGPPDTPEASRKHQDSIVNFLFRIAVSKSLGRGRARHLLANRLVASVPTISMAIALCASGAPGMAADSNGPADSVNGSAPAGNSSGGDIVKLGLLVVSDSSSDASALPSRPLRS